MHEKRCVPLLACAAVLLSVGFIAQTPFEQVGHSSTEAAPIADRAFWNESIVAEAAMGGERRVCADRFDDPRPYCRSCCGSWGLVRRWARCCTDGEDTNCYERFCAVGPPVQPAPDVACMMPAPELSPPL